MTNAYQQYRAQRAMARLQRARHGADTTLDDAEERHERIADWLEYARFYVPVLLIWAAPWVGMKSFEWTFISIAVAFTAFIIGLYVGAFVGWLYRPDRKGRGDSVREWFYRLGALPMFGIGVMTGTISLIAAGAGLVMLPSLWKRWERWVMNNTKYARLRRSVHEDPAPPRLIE